MRFDCSKINVREFLETLDVSNIVRNGDEWFYSCPFEGHKHGDSHPSASMQEKTTFWNCFGCHRSGNAVAFLAMHEGVSPVVALGWLREKYEGDPFDPAGQLAASIKELLTPRPKPPVIEPQPIVPNWYDIDWHKAKNTHNNLIPGYMNYMLVQRGFGANALTQWEVGWDPVSDRIVLPIRNSNNDIVGAKGRAWKPGQDPRYKVLGGVLYPYAPVKIGQVVYGIDKVDPKCILVEGELNAISAWEKGFSAIAVSGSSLTDTQARLIRNAVDDITIIFDDDPAGSNGAVNAAEKLTDYMSVWVNFTDPERDIATLTVTELEDVIGEARSWTAVEVESRLARLRAGIQREEKR